jgi:hypothetical protein
VSHLEDKGIESIWQISGGPTMRSYSNVFLKYGVGLIGPGDAGAWKAGREDAEFDGSFVRRFAGELRVGDGLLLRTSNSRINAVGIVASDYLYLNQFDDVNGWDLQHARRVRWFKLPEPYDFGGPVFGANPARLSRVANEPVLDYAKKFLNSPPTYWHLEPLPDLPNEQAFLLEIPDYLRASAGEAQDLFNLYVDPSSFGEGPLEDELVTHLIIPFLRSLGWPPELIGIKWRRIDVSIFRSLPRNAEHCKLIIEAKRLGTGVEGALTQAKSYLEALGILRDIVVTDGIRYRLYSCLNGFTPVAYANLARLKEPALKLFEMMRNT